MSCPVCLGFYSNCPCCDNTEYCPECDGEGEVYYAYDCAIGDDVIVPWEEYRTLPEWGDDYDEKDGRVQDGRGDCPCCDGTGVVAEKSGYRRLHYGSF